MKKQLLSLLLCFIVFPSVFGQVTFWTETFGNGAPLCGSQGQLANGFSGVNGAWTVVSTGTNGGKANEWFVSPTEAGMGVNNCGNGCIANSGLDNNTLHVGNVVLLGGAIPADQGAAYYAAGTSATSKRAETPTINCSGRSSITLSFLYMENGEGADDDASVWYYDGSVWALLSNPAKTPTTCAPQGIWTAYSIALPISADNNSNVKIGFNWINDADLNATDPSFAVDDIILEVPSGGSVPVVTFSASDTTLCTGQCVNFTGNATNGPITSWTWTFSGGTPGSSSAQNPANICYNTAGTYNVQLIANNSFGPGTLIKTGYIVVTDNPTVTVVPIADSVCPGGAVGLTAGGATSYAWLPVTGLNNPAISNPVATPGSTTTYTVTGTTAGCTGAASTTITVLPNPTVSISPNVASICPGDSIMLTASGATTYAWLPSGSLSASNISNPWAFPLVLTTYTVTGTLNGCTGQTTAAVSISPVPSISFTPANPFICNSGSVQVTASGATSYSWSPTTGLSDPNIADPIATPASTTTYTVIGSDGSCTGSATVTVTVGSNPVVSVVPAFDSICAGDSVQLTASGAISYSWLPAAGLSAANIDNPYAFPSGTTTYTVTGTSGSCMADTTVTITVLASPSIMISPLSAAICQGDSVQLTANGANSYSWSPATGLSSAIVPDPWAYPLSTATYIVTGTLDGCSGSSSVTVTVNSIPSVIVSPLSPSICSGDSVNLVASGALNYVWIPAGGLSCTSCANPDASPGATTTYTVTGDNSGCTGSTTVTLTVNPTPVVTVIPVNTTICSGQSVALVASGATTYSWTPITGLDNPATDSTNASPSVTTSYTVTGTTGGCTDNAVVLVNVNNPPSISISPSNPSICENGSVQLTASGASTYSWTPGTGLSATNISNPVANPASTTTYTLTGTSGGCDSVITITVTVIPDPIISISAPDTNICSGATVQLTASGASSYIWSPSSTLNSGSIPNPMATPIITTSYTVTGTTSGCSGSSLITINVVANPEIGSVVSQESCTGKNDAYIEISISGGLPPYTFNWNIGGSLEDLVNLVPDTYIITVSDSNNCLSTQSFDIVSSSESCYEPHIYVPNIFSPNGDGNNDLLFVRGQGVNYMKIIIYGRWGEKVFESEDINYGWNGTFRGKELNPGVYVYYLSAELEGSVQVQQQGNITLVR